MTEEERCLLWKEAEDPQTPLPRLWELSRHEDAYVRLRVGMNRQTPLEVLEILSCDPDASVRQRALTNPTCPPKWLMNHLSDEKVLAWLRYHPQAPSEVLEEIVREGKGDGYILHHPNVTARVVQLYAAQGSVWETLKHPLLDAEGLRLVAKRVSGWPFHYKRLLEHPLLTSDMLLEARLEADIQLSDELWQDTFDPMTPEQLRQLWQRGCWAAQRAYARLRNDPEALFTLAQHANRMIRRAVAQNPATPLALLYTLARDANKHVRAGVAENPAAPAELLGELAADSNGLVRGAVALRADAPAAALASLQADRMSWIRERAAATGQG